MLFLHTTKKRSSRRRFRPWAACLQPEDPYELIFVDDGSKDRTWEQIRKAHAENENVHGVHFSRNFGKEAAIMAGLAEAKGDCAAVMDCDLQHPPQTLVEMYRNMGRKDTRWWKA